MNKWLAIKLKCKFISHVERFGTAGDSVNTTCLPAIFPIQWQVQESNTIKASNHSCDRHRQEALDYQLGGTLPPQISIPEFYYLY